MGKVCLVFLGLLMAATLSAQQIKIYGRTERDGKPEAGVMIMVFEKNTFYKKFVTDRKGEFRFSVGSEDYTILFYKPGMMPSAYHVINKMETDMLKIPVNMELTPTTLSPDTILAESKLFSAIHPEVAKAYINAIYEYDRRAPRRDTVAAATRRALIRKAVEERNRFSSYKKTTTRISDRDSAERTTIVIGPDIYDMLTDAKGAKKYYKNQKPVTETTYLFETTRRYEGVLKNRRDVKRFEKYKPMEHVKH